MANSSPLTSFPASDLTGRQARLIVDSAVDYAIVGLDLAGIIISWNVGAERIMGWTVQQAVGASAEIFFTREDIDAGIPAAEMSAAVRHGRGIDERWHLKRDGSRFWADSEMMPLSGDDGGLEGYVKVLRDRTEQHTVATALSDSEERYRTLSGSIDEGFCLIEVRCDDAARPIDYRFLEVNPAFERQTGLIDAAGSWMRDLVPDHEQHWYDVYAKVAMTGESARFTLPAQALNDRWYEVFAYRVGKPQERLVAILFSDLTERRSSEARLRASEEHLRSTNATLRSSEANLRLLLDTIGEGFYAVDRDGVTTTCNAAFLRMMGFARSEDVIGRKLHEVIHHTHPDGSRYEVTDCPIYTAAREGAATHVPEELFLPIAGEPLWVEYRATPIIQDGKRQGAICTFQNVGDRRRQDAARAEAAARRTGLLELGDNLRNLDDTGVMAAAAAEIAAVTLGCTAAGFGRVDASGERLIVEGDWAAPGAIRIDGEFPMRHYGSYIDDLLADRVAVVTDVRTDLRTAATAAAMVPIGVGALVNAPIVEMGRLSAIFYVTADRARSWSDEEVEFIREIAERTGAAIERRRAEHQLRRLADTLQLQVEARTQERDRVWQVSRDLLGVADERGVWLSGNPAWTHSLGWSADAIEGRTSEWLEHPDDRAKTCEEVAKLAAGEATLFFENRFRTTTDEYRDLSWSAVPAGGFLYCVARDVTEQKQRDAAFARAEEQLRQKSEGGGGRPTHRRGRARLQQPADRHPRFRRPIASPRPGRGEAGALHRGDRRYCRPCDQAHEPAPRLRATTGPGGRAVRRHRQHHRSLGNAGHARGRAGKHQRRGDDRCLPRDCGDSS